MTNPKDILVVTTSSTEGIKIRKYIKPISAHIVAGTGLFSDFLGSLTDVFGGRSQTYQKQLTSLYNEAIERVKIAAYELGANCVVGLKIDMDEITGKGKQMFMITATGTAVILEKEILEKETKIKLVEKFENVGVDRINTLRSKNNIISKANSEELVLNDEVWSFITTNQIDEIFPYLLKQYSKAVSNDEMNPGSSTTFHRHLVSFIDSLPDEIKLNLLYDNIQTVQNGQLIIKLSEIISELNLFDYNRTMTLLKKEDFQKSKIGLRIAKCDKPFYNKEDIKDLQAIQKYIKETFVERGKRSMKKQLLSSKEKEVWTCECGKTNDIELVCSECSRDIYGFKTNELKPYSVEKYIEEKISLITEYIE